VPLPAISEASSPTRAGGRARRSDGQAHRAQGGRVCREGGHVAEMQRRRLLSAFAEILAEDGLEGANTGHVCARAGVSRRTFYDLFADREACFTAVFEEAVERISSSIRPAYTSGRRWREGVRGALTVLLELLDEDPALVRVCLIETLKGAPAVLERRRQTVDVLAAVIDEGRCEARDKTGPGPLTAQSTVGGAISVICSHALERDPRPLRELLDPLMSMIVHPYLGAAAARRELEHQTPCPPPAPANDDHTPDNVREPFKNLPIRITFRTARVLATIAANPGANNREIARHAGVTDQGQMSKLLRRLQGCGLIENRSPGHDKGEPNAWRLTQHGQAIQQTIQLP
jgi:AcrR family transcriptional regulator